MKCSQKTSHWCLDLLLTGEITIKVLFNISVRRKQHNGLQKDTFVFEWSVYENKDLVKCDIYSKTDPLI